MTINNTNSFLPFKLTHTHTHRIRELEDVLSQLISDQKTLDDQLSESKKSEEMSNTAVMVLNDQVDHTASSLCH